MQFHLKRCHRLHRSSNPASAGLLEHRRRTWDTISLRCVTHSVLLTGVGVYNTMGGGGGEVMICVDARPLEDNPSLLQCQCLHGTTGVNCDRCATGFTQKKWRQVS